MMFKDRNGKEIKVGSRVAYNLSGEVALGTVDRINDGVPETDATKAWRRSYKVWPTIFVRPDKPWANLASQRGVSKVSVNYLELSTKVVVIDD